MKAKILIVIACTGILAAVFWLVNDSFFSNWLYVSASKGIPSRDIGTNIELWTNGYLGLFFRFKMFGWVNWLAIPLGIYFLFTFKRRKRWELAIFLSILLSTIFLSIKGYMNFRYQFTLYPILTPLICMAGWELIKKKNNLIKWGSIAGVFVLAICNLYSTGGLYKYYFNHGVGNGKPGTKFPYGLIKFINESLPETATVVPLNQPILYYHTNKSSKGSGNTYWLVRGHNMDYAKYELVFDDQGYELYSHKDPAVYKKEMAKLKQKIPDFSINWGELNIDILKEEPVTHITDFFPPMKLLGGGKDFVFKHIDRSGEKCLRLMKNSLAGDGRSLIQFGYIQIRESLDLSIKGGDTVFFKVLLRQSKLRKHRVKLFIQDKTSYWLRNEIYYSNESGEKMMVGKKIRDGVKNISMGIRWEPESHDEWIEIDSIEIYIIKN